MDGTMQDVSLSVARILEHGRRRHPRARCAVIDPSGTVQSSNFADIGSRAAATANALAGLGVGPDSVVATFGGSTIDHIEMMLAVPSMGAVILPVNPQLSADHIAYILGQFQISVMWVEPWALPLLEPIAGQLETLRDVMVSGADIPAHSLGDRIAVHAAEDLLDGCATTYDWPEVDERQAAAIATTSGTTGRPKAVAYTHRSIWLHSMQIGMTESFGLTAADDILIAVPLSHVLGWGVPYASIMTGASMVLPRAHGADPRPSGADLARALAQFRPNKAIMPPTLAREMLRRLDDHPQDVSHLCDLVIGGSAMPPAVYDAYMHRYGIAPLQAWGMTETSPLGTIVRPDTFASATERRKQALGHGRFPAALEARLVDAEGEVPADGSTLGELQVRGPWVTGRYLGDPEDNADRFEDGWLRTGDVASLTSTGYLTVTDRVDDVIHSGGEMIPTVFLENAVMRDLRVAEAACVGVPDPKWGSRPLVLVVLRAGYSASAGSLWRELGGQVDEWMRPDHWAIVEAIPRTSVGKFDKRAIRAAAAAGEYDITTVEH